MKRAVSLFVVVFGLGACVANQNYDAVLQGWQGQPVQSLYNNWGPPNSVNPLADGGELLTYNSQVMSNVSPQVSLEDELSGAPSYADNPFFSSQETFFCTTTFTVNNGFITDYSYEGDDCNQQ